MVVCLSNLGVHFFKVGLKAHQKGAMPFPLTRREGWCESQRKADVYFVPPLELLGLPRAKR